MTTTLSVRLPHELVVLNWLRPTETNDTPCAVEELDQPGKSGEAAGQPVDL